MPAVGGPVPGETTGSGLAGGAGAGGHPGAIFGQGTAGHPDQTGSRWGREREQTLSSLAVATRPVNDITTTNYRLVITKQRGIGTGDRM